MNTPGSNTEFFGLIDGLANHEAKSLVGGVLGAHPKEWFDASRLYQEVKHRQAGEEGYCPSYMMPFKYCQRSLEGIGAVVLGNIQNHLGTVDAYKASELGATTGLATVGAVVGWSLDYKTLSVQELFSGSQSAGTRRAPATRYIIYKSLLEAGDTGLTYGQIETRVSGEVNKKRNLLNIFNEPRNETIFDITTNLRNHNPVYRIERSHYQGFKNPDNFQSVTRAVYAGMEQLASMGKSEVTLDELIEASATAFSGVSKVALRRRIVDTASSSGISGLDLIDGDGRQLSKETQSSVKLQQAIKEPVADLVERLDRVRVGNDQKTFHALAKSVIGNPKYFAALMVKARMFSPNYRAMSRKSSTSDLIKQVIANTQSDQVVDIGTIQRALEEQGEVYKQAAIMVNLRSLIKRGEVIMEEEAVREDKDVKRRVYTLAK